MTFEIERKPYQNQRAMMRAGSLVAKYRKKDGCRGRVHFNVLAVTAKLKTIITHHT